MTVQVDDLVLNAPPMERRATPRFRFHVLMPAVLGRGDGLILDISVAGARVVHYAPYPLDSRVRLVFFYGGRRFAVTTRVLASRVVGLGSGPRGSTKFESRLKFIDCPADAAETLEDIIEQIENERLRTWVANASRDTPAVPHPPSFDAAQYFLRCRFRGAKWRKCWTREAEQPSDGFTVPATLSEQEVEILCSAYEKMDDEGHDLVRATATIAG